ncbi:hypothetical protein [Deinococcus peraridilitoris]|uniref:Uncharacterized protein n=1 Tax=Deinococcus peraridilitoris (strain DSM 19664 / LMG 22246 / CIP 109416 / KR-200) TaxID=937777 RepID=L0A537_DEIPD|nr:hypothetical protein [Deinococcus peraridilitoris]AFZ68292.1 hypothetical protein Deipe_2829 [Deinococcus peraridilitoris DSM 19664]
MAQPTPGPSRGFELDAHLTFSRPLARVDAERVAAFWGLRPTYYGEDEVRALRLTGELPREEVLRLLQVGLEGGTLRAAEVGLRGFLRSPDGKTDYVPWTRNKVLRRDAWNEVGLEEGLKYTLE